MPPRLRREAEYFFGALRFFTRFPVPAWVGHSPLALNRATRYFPAVGLIVGAVAALSFSLASLIWPTSLAVLIAMASTLYCTGAFHEDGWSDMVDGFGGGWDKAQILNIMKDSRIGSFGAIALVMLLLAKFSALVALAEPGRSFPPEAGNLFSIFSGWSTLPAALIAAHACSRFCAASVLRHLDYVRETGTAKPLATRISFGEWFFAGLSTVPALLLLPTRSALLACLFALLATLWLTRLFKRQIGGYTGDCLGATQQLSEVAFYCGLLCKFS
ncbi:MAG: adenosylcobinamide-GDP ribazoletransferase [Pseudomonadota bacterium]